MPQGDDGPHLGVTRTVRPHKGMIYAISRLLAHSIDATPCWMAFLFRIILADYLHQEAHPEIF